MWISKIFDQSVRMADKMGSTVSAPRTVGRQQHWSNVSSSTPIEHYKKNVAILFLDHVLSHLNEQFSTLSVNASYLLTIVPSVMFSKPSKLSEIISTSMIFPPQSYWKRKCADGSLNTVLCLLMSFLIHDLKLSRSVMHGYILTSEFFCKLLAHYQ